MDDCCPETHLLLQFGVETVPTKETDGMKRSRFTEEQIIAILKQQESGVATVDVCREHGISSATSCKGRAKFGGAGGIGRSRMRTRSWWSDSNA